MIKRDWSYDPVTGQVNAVDGTVATGVTWAPNGHLFAASATLKESAEQVVRWYFDDVYDGPPGPQDAGGGDGVPVEIRALIESLALASGKSYEGYCREMSGQSFMRAVDREKRGAGRRED